MRNLVLVSIFLLIAFVFGCETKQPGDLKVIKWGPDEPLKVGTIPNKQADGKMGIWIEVSSTAGMGEMQVLFVGKPAPTAVQAKLITSGISPEDLAAAGDKKIEIKVVSTGQIIPVGTLKVIP